MRKRILPIIAATVAGVALGAAAEAQVTLNREIPRRAVQAWRVNVGPGDFFEVHANNSPDDPDEEDDVYFPEDYAGDYGLDENDDGDDE